MGRTPTLMPYGAYDTQPLLAGPDACLTKSTALTLHESAWTTALPLRGFRLPAFRDSAAKNITPIRTAFSYPGRDLAPVRRVRRP